VVLAVEAVRFFASDLTPVLSAHARGGSAVTIGVNSDGTPAGVVALDRSVFEFVPKAGFIDLKEQLIAKVRGNGGRVRGVMLPEPGGLPLRTREQFIRAITTGMGIDGGEAGRYAARKETTAGVGERVGSIVSPGAEVEESATLIHSLAMPGSTVGAGAVVARSILLPGATVGPGGSAVDAVVGPGGERRAHGGDRRRRARA
jgi:NDP-sugar pyrophosphorylase family protein